MDRGLTPVLVCVLAALAASAACEGERAGRQRLCAILLDPDTPLSEIDAAMEELAESGTCPTFGRDEPEPEPEQGEPEPPPEPEPDEDIYFTTHVVPILNTYSCEGCHNDDPNAAAYSTGLYYNQEPLDIYENLLSRPEVINFLDPPASWFLTKPLYEDPPNHPNASYADTNDPPYVTVLTWIEQGAPYGPPDPEPDVPEGWTCTPGWYDALDGCDCGCGVIDPDCDPPVLSSCEFTWCEEDGNRGGTADPDDIARCR